MSLNERLTKLPLTVDGYRLERLEQAVATGFTRVTTTVVLHGNGQEGRGEDVTYTAADPEGKKYRTVIDSAAKCLVKYQWDESQGKKPSDVVYGGAGYGGGSRPDLSNTQFFLDALIAAKVPSSDPAFK